MKKQTYILFIVSLLLVAVVLLMVDTGMWGKTPLPGQFRIDRHADIVKVEMTGQDDSRVSLERAPDGQWWLNETYRANESAIRDLLSILRRMETRRPVPLIDRPTVSVMLQSEGVEVGVYTAAHRISLPGRIALLPFQKPVRRFTFAGYAEGGEIAYLQMHRSDEPFEVQLQGVSGSWADVFKTMPHHWVDPVVIQLAPHQIRQVQLDFTSKPGESFTINRLADGMFRLASSRGDIVEIQPDDALMMHYLGGFSELHYQRLIAGSEDHPPADLLHDIPFVSLAIKGDGTPEIKLDFYRRLPPDDGSLQSPYRDYDINRMYIRINKGDYALAQYYVFSRVLQPLSYFLSEHHQ